MADNVAYNPSGSTLFATKDDGTAHHQKVITEGLKADASVQQLAKQEDEQHASGDLGIMALGVRKDSVTALAGSDADYQPIIFDASGRLWVNGSGVTQPISAASLPLPSGAATSALQGGGLPSALASDRLKVDGSGVTQPVSGTVTASNTAGDVAHGTADSGNPVKVGAKAANALPTAEANAERVNAIADLWGRLLTAEIDPAMQMWKSYNTTSQQTGADVWTPGSGKKIAITHLVIGVYGTTAGRLILWFGDNADTTYTAGTDQLIVAASFAPNASSKPGLVLCPRTPIFCTTADREIHITTDAAMSVDITLYGYEW